MDESASEQRSSVVLLVEDNSDHAELITRCLNEDGISHELYHVRDGEEALDYLRREGSFKNAGDSPRPDLIFLDLRLPRLDGLSLLRKIKSSDLLQAIPVVVLTTSTAPSDIESAYAAHANGYLAKPLNFNEFRSHLQFAARFWLRCNMTPTPEADR